MQSYNFAIFDNKSKICCTVSRFFVRDYRCVLLGSELERFSEPL